MHENMTRSLDNTIQINTKLECHLENHVWHKMMGWCKAASSEVSGMGLCKIVKGKFVVYDVFFPLQYGSGGYTELDDRALAKLQISLYNKKIPADNFRFWWHTHYNFNVFWSGTDDNNATTLARANGQWELSLVINQAGEYRCRADFFKKVHPLVSEPVHVLVDNMEVYTIKNSKRHRAKPHYKADVKRWVRPMSELPEKQKPKIEICAPINNWTPPTSTENYNGEFSDDWMYNRFSDIDENEYCPKCANRWCKSGSICGERQAESKGKTYHELKNGDDFGGFKFLNGLLVDPKDYASRAASMQREETLEEMTERIGREVKPEDICACEDDRCVNYELCIHCDLCGGRCRAGDGYCSGCFKAYELMLKGDKGAEPESATFN